MGAWLSTFAPASPSPWPALPPELVDLIFRCLSSHADHVRFASVCRHWRHVVANYSRHTLPPPLPWLLHFGGSACPQMRTFNDGHKLNSILFHDYKDDYCHGSFGSWILFEAPGPSRQNTLTNPLTGATVQLPSECNEPERLNPYELRPCGTTSAYCRVQKIIVCSPQLIAAIVRHHQDLVVFCRPGMSSWSTGLRWDCSYRCYQDMAFYEGRIYAVTTSGNLFVHEVADDINHTVEPRVCRIEIVIQGTNKTFDGTHISNHIYLVISCTGKLLMVERRKHLQHIYDLESSGKIFRVFEADFKKSRWLEVESLGDQVIFVGANCSRAIRASDYGSCLQGSRIYFQRDTPYWDGFNDHICSVYDMCSKTICPISLGQKYVSCALKVSWFFP